MFKKTSKQTSNKTSKKATKRLAPVPELREGCRHCSGKGHTAYINRKINCGVCFGRGYIMVGR